MKKSFLRHKKRIPMSDLCLTAPIVLAGKNFSATVTPEISSINIGLFVTALILDVVCLSVWILGKNKYDYSRIRPTSVPVLLGFGYLFTIITVHLAPVTLLSFPCALFLFLLALCVPLIVGSIDIKLLIFFFLSKFSEEVASYATNQGYMMGSNISDDLIDESESPIDMFSRYLDVIRLGIGSLCSRTSKKVDSEQDRQRYLRALQFLMSPSGNLFVVFILLFPFLLVAIIEIIVNPAFLFCYGCYINDTLVYMMIAFGVVSAITSFMLFIRVRHFHDPWDMRKEAIWNIFFAILTSIVFPLGIFVSLGRGGFSSSFSFTYLMSVTLGAALVSQTIVPIMVPGRQYQSLSRSSTKLVEITETEIKLHDILKNDKLREAFEAHLTSEYGLESLLFLTDAQNWKNQFYDIAPSARKARAKRMVNIYIDEQGLLCVNIPSDMYTQIRQDISKPDVKESIFDDAIKEVEHLLTVGAVQRFVRSKFYRKEEKDGNIQNNNALVQNVL